MPIVIRVSFMVSLSFLKVRTNLTEKATEETGQKETEGAENGTKAG